MSGQQSADAEAATLTIRPTGDLGRRHLEHSIEAIRDVVAKIPKPSGLSVYVSGPSPLATDTLHATDKSLINADDRDDHPDHHHATDCLPIDHDSADTAVRECSITLATARGVVSFLVGLDVHRYLVVRVPTWSWLWCWVPRPTTASFTSVDTTKRVEWDSTRKRAYYESVANTPHVIMGSGIAISGATLCLSLTQLNYFRTLGPPCFVSMVVAVLAALTLGPALLTIGQQDRLDQPRNETDEPDVARLGTAIARWPVPMIAVAALIIPLCILNLDDLQGELQRPGFRTGERRVQHRLRRRR